MSTRSDIIVRRTDGSWARIYCHWDGSPGHHGPILTEHYNSQALAEELVEGGDLSVLAEKCDKPPYHSFDHQVKGYCVYYGRDRGEKGTEATIAESLDEAWPSKDTGTEYTYVWQDGEWFVGDADAGPGSLRPVVDVLNKTEPDPPKPNIKAFGKNVVIGRRK